MGECHVMEVKKDVAHPAGSNNNDVIVLYMHNLRETAPENERIVLVLSFS